MRESYLKLDDVLVRVDDVVVIVETAGSENVRVVVEVGGPGTVLVVVVA
jgi:hypothetical protein